MTLPQHIHYWLLREQKMVAAEVSASLLNHRAWVGVYPPRPDRGSFLIRYFEVAEDLVAQDFDIHEDQLINKETIFAFDEEELTHVLSRWFDSLEHLKGPSFSDYPI